MISSGISSNHLFLGRSSRTRAADLPSSPQDQIFQYLAIAGAVGVRGARKCVVFSNPRLGQLSFLLICLCSVSEGFHFLNLEFRRSITFIFSIRTPTIHQILFDPPCQVHSRYFHAVKSSVRISRRGHPTVKLCRGKR